VYVQRLSQWSLVVALLVSTLILWNVFSRISQGLGVNLLMELWSRNIMNVFKIWRSIMLNVSDGAFDRTLNALYNALMRRPQLVSRMGGRGRTSNREFYELASRVFPVDDPLILEVHQRVLESFKVPVLVDEEETLPGSRAVLHVWYGALKEEERCSGQRVPVLDRTFVERSLPKHFVPPGTKLELTLDRAELQPLQHILPAIQVIGPMIGGPRSDWLQVAFLYPLIVITRLLNEAATEEPPP